MQNSKLSRFFLRLSGTGSVAKRSKAIKRRRVLLERLEERWNPVADIGITGAEFIWDGDGGNDLWSNPDNWLVVGDDENGLPDANDDVVFDSSAVSTHSLMDLEDLSYGGYGGTGFLNIKTLTLDWLGDLEIDSGLNRFPLELRVQEEMTWKAGTISGELAEINEATVQVFGSLTIEGPGSKILAHPLELYGTSSWTGGDVTVQDDGVVRNYGTFTATGSGQLAAATGNPDIFDVHEFENRNLFIRSGDGGTSTFDGIEFYNYSSVDIELDGTLQMKNADYEQGSIASPTTVVNGVLSATASNGAAVQIYDGRLSGTGIIQGNVTNSGGTVAPGNSIGTLTIQGNYTQQSGGQLEIHVDGDTNASDKLVVNNLATLGGLLNVIRSGSFDPGDTFQTITFARRTGDFATATGLEPFNNPPFLRLSPIFHPLDLTLVTETSPPATNPVLDARVLMTFVGCVYNSRSRSWIQNVTIKNSSTTVAITGPIYLVFEGNPLNVVNRTGIGTVGGMAGKAYIRIDPPGGVLAANASLGSFPISTTVPARPTMVFTGPGAP